MDIQKVKRQYRLKQWIEIVSQCRSSGQTVATWCAENNINPKQYYYWLRCVRMAACEFLPKSGSSESSIVPVTLPGSLLEANQAAPTTAGSPAPLILRLGSAIIELHNDASPELIAHTVKALAYAR
ncbi:IS66 family insertion sequence element accessory protein TnpA [Sporomusa acidovorans]|uniref:IS66 family insertion sequence element accessory protein TnpA n=1 Tax=Sporomusa acidovorans TaxID=112900 RepID=UPI000886B101|nr:IS66 family transposase [Sporomusa acidovorans]OZC19011.1 hypothetical protein SPACI_30970 [Sporomusa acidovorans DSM 3132]SDD73067.1 hypothetical protein SAMN04488499_1003185 [Sporomusa acidovorans]